MGLIRRTAVLLHRGATTSVVIVILASAGVVGMTPALATPGRSTAASAASAASRICTSAKRPKLAARISVGIKAALAGRKDSVVGLKASDPAVGLTCLLHENRHFYAASVIKVTILSALLLKVHGPSGLTKAQRSLAYQMITQSSNDAATVLWRDVGMRGMQRFLNKAGMRHTVLNDAWGLTDITARDELTLLHLLTNPGKVLGKYSRHYVLRLMSKVIPTERWGVPAGAPPDVTVHVKNGWLPYPNADDWNINSIGAFTGKHIAYQIVILTAPPPGGSQSESYGIQTVQAAAEVINRQIAGRGGARTAPASLPGPAALAAPGG
jgi:Beta-lactamase enzyme family